MRNDPYVLNSKSKEKMRTVSDRTDVKYKYFIMQLNKIKKDKKTAPGRDGRKLLLDINCWRLLFHGYEHIRDERLAFSIVEDLGDEVDTVDESIFDDNVDMLSIIYHFNVKSFYQVWEYQHNIRRLLHQIIHPQYFIGNRLAPKRNRKWSPQHQVLCTPTRHDTIPLPRIRRVLDGLVFPVIVTKNHNDYKVQQLQTTNFGDGHFITDNNQIIDCIRINNYWQTHNHLKQRLAFSFLVQTDYDEAPMVVCNNMGDVKTAWRMLGANRNEGVLIRSLGENLYENYWLLLNRKSAFVGSYTKHGYMLGIRKKRMGFITLDGDKLGNMGYKRDVLREMMWLDGFDIDRFKAVVWQ